MSSQPQWNYWEKQLPTSSLSLVSLDTSSTTSSGMSLGTDTLSWLRKSLTATMKKRKSSHVLFSFTLGQDPSSPSTNHAIRDREIFGQISEGSYCYSRIPSCHPAFEDLDSHWCRSLKDLIRAVRNARAEVNVAPSKPLSPSLLRQEVATEASLTAMSTSSNNYKSWTLGNRINPSLHRDPRYVKRHHRGRNLPTTGRPPQCRRRTGSPPDKGTG